MKKLDTVHTVAVEAEYETSLDSIKLKDIELNCAIIGSHRSQYFTVFQSDNRGLTEFK